MVSGSFHFDLLRVLQDRQLSKNISDLKSGASRSYGKFTPYCPYPVATMVRGLRSIRPCGQCVHCKVSQRNKMAGRCVAEAFMQPSICVTLTLDDCSLAYKDWFSADIWTREMDLLRRRIGYQTGKRPLVRWTAETGGTTFRPHAHALLFGVPMEWVPYKQEKYQDLSYWKYGHCTVDKVTVASAGYVVGYITDSDKKGDVIKARPSPGIGFSYFDMWCTHMLEGQKKHGWKYSEYPDPRTGLLNAPCYQVEQSWFPMDATLRERAIKRGLLEKKSAWLTDFETRLRSYQEIEDYGGPLHAQAAREKQHRKEKARNREASDPTGVNRTEVTINGYRFKI